jgi:hypothetical protein
MHCLVALRSLLCAHAATTPALLLLLLLLLLRSG